MEVVKEKNKERYVILKFTPAGRVPVPKMPKEKCVDIRKKLRKIDPLSHYKIKRAR